MLWWTNLVVPLPASSSSMVSHFQPASMALAPDKMPPRLSRGPQFGRVGHVCTTETRTVPDSTVCPVHFEARLVVGIKANKCFFITCAAVVSELGHLITWYGAWIKDLYPPR